MQQKDVIYIDVEDDITAIIGKVKASKEKIVALVPPKRIGVLQSAVNLRLLARAATGAKKRLVIITANDALAGLAASAQIPVAKNLTSRPEIAVVPTLDDDDDDVIDGEQLPVGDHAAIGSKSDDTIPSSTVAGINIDGDVKTAKPVSKDKKKKGIKVPDFGLFRKKMLFAGIGGVLFIIFLFWAIWIAPHATIVISAKTTEQSLKSSVSLGPDLETDSDNALIRSIEQKEKSSQSVDFDATGTKDVGEKATGTVVISTNSINKLGTTIPAGTQLSSTGGSIFTTTQTVTLTLSNYTGANTGIVAAASGTSYNGASGAMTGVPSGISADIDGSTSGGTEKIVKIVTQSDIDKAQEQLTSKNENDVKKSLETKFGKDVTIIKSSFTVQGGDAVSVPAVGQEASGGKAKLTREVTYVMTGVADSELDVYLDEAFEKMLVNKDNQRIYDNGSSTVKFSDFKQGDRSATADIATTAKIGPKINDDQVKEQAKGKRYGEIEGDLKSIDGVSDVQVKLSPFWVQSVPNDVKKISVEFKLVNG